jgi:aspartokinase
VSNPKKKLTQPQIDKHFRKQELIRKLIKPKETKTMTKKELLSELNKMLTKANIKFILISDNKSEDVREYKIKIKHQIDDIKEVIESNLHKTTIKQIQEFTYNEKLKVLLINYLGGLKNVK